jgi:hypothetical protein
MRGIHKGSIHVLKRLIAAFVVFVVAPCVFLAVETMATRQQVLLRSWPKIARIHSKRNLFAFDILWGVIQVPFVYLCCVCCLLVLILVF